MKVLLLGGTGVFGSRLARLLVRDGHDLTIAARNLKTAQDLAQQLNCAAQQMDRNGDLNSLTGHDVLVDAAGPYHSYGSDPYRLARAAIKAGMHYLDLSDNADFCCGIRELDDQARVAGLCVLSGMSSVPALSSAAVRALTKDEKPRVIESAILPGNRSPRGLSVMASILAQAGRPMRVWRGGMWMQATGWSSPRYYCLPKGIMRQGWQIEVPDQVLFPEHFQADSVVFRAGLELAVMRYGLAGFAAIRRWLPIPINKPVLHGFKFAADLLAPFGTDRGGMSVMVIVGQQRKWWRLLVEAGDGPFIPAIPIRALLRRDTLPRGAGPAIEVITLEEAEEAMSDLRTHTEQSSEPFNAIFPQVLGSRFDELPKLIQDTHLTADVSGWHGRASVRRGKSWWSRLLAGVFRFPPATDDVFVKVTKTVTPKGETWQRWFGDRTFKSHLSPSPYGMTERFGLFTFRLGLTVKDGRLEYPVNAGRIGPIPLPRWLLPVSKAQEYVENERFHFDVKVLSPLTQKLLVHYQGHLSPMRDFGGAN